MHQVKHILRESFLRVVTVKLSNFYKNLMCNIQKERKEYNISKLVLGSDFEIFIEGEKAYFLVCFKIWSKIKKEQNWEDSMKTGSVRHWNSVCEITWLVTDPGLFKQPFNHSSITWNRSWSSVNSMPSTLLKTIATSLEFPSSSFRLEHQTPTLEWPLMTNSCRLSTVPPTSLALFCSTPGLLQYIFFFSENHFRVLYSPQKKVLPHCQPFSGPWATCSGLWSPDLFMVLYSSFASDCSLINPHICFSAEHWLMSPHYGEFLSWVFSQYLIHLVQSKTSKRAHDLCFPSLDYKEFWQGLRVVDFFFRSQYILENIGWMNKWWITLYIM